MTLDRKTGDQPKQRDFVESLARGLDVLSYMGTTSDSRSVSDVATGTGLARPTARRLLLTLESLGYLRSAEGDFSLTPKVLELGTSVIASQNLWETARPHMMELVRATNQSSSMAQLDGSDIVYMARVPVPKIIALAVTIGTKFPAVVTSMGRVLLADLDKFEIELVLEQPSRSGITARAVPSKVDLTKSLTEVRDRGWALADEYLALGVRSVAAPILDTNGRVAAAMNVTVHAAETSLKTLTQEYLPLLLAAAEATTADWAQHSRIPLAEVPDE